jgi:serine/threonine protein kinase
LHVYEQSMQAVELWSGWPLFGDPPPEADGDIREEDFDLQQMVVYAGEEFNSDLLLHCQNRDDFFDAKGLQATLFGFRSLTLWNYVGNLKRAVPEKQACLTTIIETLRKSTLQLPEEEHVPAADFLRRCLRLDPRDRESAAQLLQHDWLSSNIVQ